jgi:hypothetical protein
VRACVYLCVEVVGTNSSRASLLASEWLLWGHGLFDLVFSNQHTQILSANLCSLLHGRDRYAMSVMWVLTPDGDVKSTWFGRSIIRSAYQVCLCVEARRGDSLWGFF